MSTPLDKRSRPMKPLVEIDFEEVSAPGSELPEHGVLTVFVSEDLDNCQAKDPSCFKVLWQADVNQPPNMVTTVSPANKVSSNASIETCVKDCFLLGDEHPRLNEAKGICAFSANGITYNEARSRDDCYSHLISDSANWRLLLSLRMNATDYLLLIRQEDFTERRLERAWLVRFKGNS